MNNEEKQEYINKLFNNADLDMAGLTDTEKVFIDIVRKTQGEITTANEEVVALNSEIEEKGKKIEELVKSILFLNGRVEGKIESLLALKELRDKPEEVAAPVVLPVEDKPKDA